MSKNDAMLAGPTIKAPSKITDVIVPDTKANSRRVNKTRKRVSNIRLINCRIPTVTPSR